MSTTVRRNEPCPCGSGMRFKDCHGRLDASPAPAAAPRPAAGSEVEAVVQRSLQAHQQGLLDEAERGYRDVLARQPGHPVATHYLGMASWQRGDVRGAEAALRAALAADDRIPDFHNNLGLLLRDTGRAAEAVECFRRALAIDPAWAEAASNLGLAHEAAGDWDAAIAAYESALARQPQLAVAHQNLARVLLTLRRFPEAWEHYRWRLLAQGLAQAVPQPAAPRLPASLEGRRFALLAEQGVGDILYFLRFAPELVRRGARLAFRGDPRLHGMLERTGLFAEGFGGDGVAAPGLEAMPIGDLAWQLGANTPAEGPPLPLKPLEARIAKWSKWLAAGGPRPWIALTWRGGVASTGPSRTHLKEIAIPDLAERLRGRPGTWFSVQRLPRANEREALEYTLGQQVHDLGAVNDDLEDALAVMALVDDYVGVSNANTHLRAGVGLPCTVLVPHPPEWRWGAEGDSPWFPRATVVRQTRERRWPAT